MASLKQLDERRYKITVSNGYRPDGRKVCKARTLHVPKRIPRRSVLQYVMHAAEELEKEFKYGYAEDGEKTFEAYARGWLERQTHYAPSTLAGYRQMLERVYGEIGQIRLKELRPITIEYLLERLRKQPGPSGRKLGEATVQKYWGVVSVVLNDAKRNQIIAYNPAQCIGKPEAKYREQKIPTDKEAKRFLGLLEQAPVLYRSYFTLMMLTGMRRGELCALRWSDIDWRQRALHIRRNVVKLSGQPILVKEPKTRAGVRVVYLSKELCKLLRVWQKESVWEKEQRGAGGLEEEDYLFRQPGGDPMVPSTFTFRFKKILREGNLPDNLNVHSLRHTNASMLIAQGVDVRTVAGLLGHAQPSTTLDIYSHAFDKNKKLAQEKLAEAMGL